MPLLVKMVLANDFCECMINYFLSKFCFLKRKLLRKNKARMMNKDNESLPIHNISYFFGKKKDMISEDCINMMSNELNVPQNLINSDLKRLMTGFRDDITCCLEYPYVDEFYRDSYYAFYSHKHAEYSRYCFRLSFFDSSVSEENFYSIDTTDKYYGYVVLRPTPKRIIGYTFISPLVYKEHNFSCCLCERTSSIMGLRLTTSAFPFSGQDGDVGSCSETSLVIMMDYFSRKYNRYKRLLPSDIAKYLSESNLEREYPSRGLNPDTISQLLHTYGFSVRIYANSVNCENSNSIDENLCYDSDEFKKHLMTYIDSGFPVFVCTKKHAFLIIGKENKFPFDDPQLITMNDNDFPYKKIVYSDEIVSFIVPLSERIYLDAEAVKPIEALEKIANEYDQFFTFKSKSENIKIRLYLTTSRLFKDYIVKSKISKESRILICCTAMPRFVWVCEIIDTTNIYRNYEETPISSLCVFDATECDDSYNYLLLAKTNSFLLIPTENGGKKKYSIHKTSNDTLYPAINNLKGEHTRWQS